MLRTKRLLAVAAFAGLAVVVPAVGSADAATPVFPDSPELGIPFDPPCEILDACVTGEPPVEEPETPEVPETPETPETPDPPAGEPTVEVAPRAVAVSAAPNFTG